MPNLKVRYFSRSSPGALQQKQCGIALLESLVSILVLAIGVLALASVQLRTLAET
jgi:Tfp pilus assembly protein PilV